MGARPVILDKCPKCGTRLVQRSVEQNDRLHALLHDIATQKQWAGQWLDVEAWKRLMTAAWERSEGRAAEIYPSVDQAGFDVVYRRTSRMNKKELSELIEFVTAWAIEQGIKLEEEKAQFQGA
jgi:hypothetical protein